MTRKTIGSGAALKNPFTYRYDQSEYVVLSSAARRDADTGRMVIKKPDTQTEKPVQKREK